jgi:hypothetical protein
MCPVVQSILLLACALKQSVLFKAFTVKRVRVTPANWRTLIAEKYGWSTAKQYLLPSLQTERWWAWTGLRSCFWYSRVLLRNELAKRRYRRSLNHKLCRLGIGRWFFMPRSAPYEKSKFLGSGGSMVARLKLKEIDGRAPQGVEPAA